MKILMKIILIIIKIIIIHFHKIIFILNYLCKAVVKMKIILMKIVQLMIILIIYSPVITICAKIFIFFVKGLKVEKYKYKYI